MLGHDYTPNTIGESSIRRNIFSISRPGFTALLCFASLTFSATAPRTGVNLYPVQGDFRQPDSIGANEQGLNYEYYEGEWTALPDFTTLTAVKKDTCDSFELAQVPHRDSNIGVVFKGFLNIVLDGNYTFYVRSKDGAKLLIGNTVVVDNDGLHSTPEEKSGAIALAATSLMYKHPITVVFFGTSAPELTMSFECTDFGITKKVIDGSILFRPYSRELPIVTVTRPNGGESYKLGDTMIIEWTYPSALDHLMLIQLSLDNGKTFFDLNTKAYKMTNRTGAFTYVIPDDKSYISDKALVQVTDYITDGPWDKGDATFRITDGDESGKKGGCGSGATAALLPPIFIKAGSWFKKKKKLKVKS
jgi:hypothetical protein